MNWKSDFGHVGLRVAGYVWYLELSQEARHEAQQMRYQNVRLSNGHCLCIIILFWLVFLRLRLLPWRQLAERWSSGVEVWWYLLSYVHVYLFISMRFCDWNCEFSGLSHVACSAHAQKIGIWLYIQCYRADLAQTCCLGPLAMSRILGLRLIHAMHALLVVIMWNA